MQITKITCDACGEDLTETGASPKYRLHLFAKQLSFTENYRHAILVHPPIDEDKHFCSVSCLAKWSAGKVAR